MIRLTIIYFFAIFITTSLGNLVVYSPEEVRQKFLTLNNQIEFKIAKFGIIPYGKKLLGRLYQPELENGCGSLNFTNFTFSGNENDPANAPIVIVDRGICSLISKARYAQLIGAKMLIILDNREELVSQAILADDGHGSAIHIPTILISKSDGQILKDSLKSVVNETPIQISITFPLNDRGKVIPIDFWFTSGDVNAYLFAANMADYILEFGWAIKFQPHYVLWYSSDSRNKGWTINPPDCVSNGRYCSPDPDLSGPLNGTWVINEDLKQIGIYKTWDHYGWLDYMEKISLNCIKNDVIVSPECFDEVFNQTFSADEIGISKFKYWIRDTFENYDSQKGDNSILASEMDIFHNSQVNYWPSILIDHVFYNGPLLPAENVALAICNAIDYNPSMCTDIRNTLEEKIRFIEEYDYNIYMIVGICGLATGLFLIFLYFYRRVLKKELTREMSVQLQQMVTDYAVFTNKYNLMPKDRHGV